MNSGTGHTDEVTADELRAAIGRVSLEVQALADRVAELVAAVEALSPHRPDPAGPGSWDAGGAPEPGEIGVRVSPLPELAMAAVAETVLRGLPSVGQVVSVERANDQARFVLEVDDGADLVGEIRRAMPVPITVDTAPDGSLGVVLEWGWARFADGAD